MTIINKPKNQDGMSLMEMLIVIGIFSVLGVLTTRAVILTVTGGKKSENLIKVRENINYSLGVIERQLRNANSITDCTNANTLRINYLDKTGRASSFSCVNLGNSTIGYVASGSARLTSDSIDITACSFTCVNPSAGSAPRSIKIEMQAKDATATNAANSIVDASTEVLLRNY